VRIFVTGSAGFIGFHSSKELLRRGHSVFGYDNINNYYDPRFKIARLEELSKSSKFSFTKGNLADKTALKTAWDTAKPDMVLHLGAQAGVRYSIENPDAYVESNLVGFQNVIELARHAKVDNFVYASSSSVYGGNKTLPFSETQTVSNPISFYAATKLANELTAKAYWNLFQLPSAGLRFFTVYGPFGRPDMAMFKFAELMRAGKPIEIYNEGKMWRDFTYVDDIVSGVMAALEKPEPAEVYNLGRGEKVELMSMVELLETYLGIKADRRLLPMQMGDVEATLSDVSKAQKNLGYAPKVSLAEGMRSFCDWYKAFTSARS
jgi:UDP-glucuronate 4-epimerase